MTPDEWIARTRALAAEHGALTETAAPTCRRALLGVDSLFRTAPTPLLEAYARVPERALDHAAQRRTDAVTGGDFRWSLPGDDADLLSWALAAGAQARALDKVLFTSAQSHYGPADPEDWLCPESRAYAIPRARVREPVARRENQRFTPPRHPASPHPARGSGCGITG